MSPSTLKMEMQFNLALKLRHTQWRNWFIFCRAENEVIAFFYFITLLLS